MSTLTAYPRIHSEIYFPFLENGCGLRSLHIRVSTQKYTYHFLRNGWGLRSLRIRVSAYPRIQLFPGYSFEVSGYSAVTPLTASSRDAGPATANEPTSVELLAMLECSVSTSERCYEEAIITERSYSHTTFFLGICHCMLIARFSNCAWSIQMLMS